MNNADANKARMTRELAVAQLQEQFWQQFKNDGPTPKQVIRLLARLMKAKETKFVKIKKSLELVKDDQDQIVEVRTEPVTLPLTRTGKPKRGIRIIVETAAEAQIAIDVDALAIQQGALRDYFTLTGMNAPIKMDLGADPELTETLAQVVARAGGKTRGLPKDREMI